jgi:hypothetical protein
MDEDGRIAEDGTPGSLIQRAGTATHSAFVANVLASLVMGPEAETEGDISTQGNMMSSLTISTVESDANLSLANTTTSGIALHDRRIT